jgi:hypothetical protein
VHRPFFTRLSETTPRTWAVTSKSCRPWVETMRVLVVTITVEP